MIINLFINDYSIQEIQLLVNNLYANFNFSKTGNLSITLFVPWIYSFYIILFYLKAKKKVFAYNVNERLTVLDKFKFVNHLISSIEKSLINKLIIISFLEIKYITGYIFLEIPSFLNTKINLKENGINRIK